MQTTCLRKTGDAMKNSASKQKYVPSFHQSCEKFKSFKLAPGLDFSTFSFSLQFSLTTAAGNLTVIKSFSEWVSIKYYYREDLNLISVFISKRQKKLSASCDLYLEISTFVNIFFFSFLVKRWVLFERKNSFIENLSYMMIKKIKYRQKFSQTVFSK